MIDLADKRYCFYVNDTMHVEGKGYRPSVIVEGERGHRPNGGGES